MATNLRNMTAGFEPAALYDPVETRYYPVVAVQQDRAELGDFSTSGSWTILNTNTTGLASTANHVLRTGSVGFEKANATTDQDQEAGIYSAVDLNLTRFTGAANVEVAFHTTAAATTEVSYAFVRLGTDASNYNEWQIPKASLTGVDAWTFHTVALYTSQNVTGNGWDPSQVSYLAVGYRFDTTARTLAKILCDGAAITNAQLTVT